MVAAAETPRPRGSAGIPARIDHLDGSGRATIVEIDPGVPGREEFLHATPQPIPRRGELILPTATPRPSPSPFPRPGRDDER